jgi:hypothetical protein
LPRAKILQTLAQSRLADSPHSALFVPPENSGFWSAYRDCRAISAFIPAFLGVPMIRGLNPDPPKCHNEPAYGFPAYPADAVAQPTSDADLCMRARRWKLTTIFVLDAPTEVRRIECKL